jgi:uncharacterized membrane protein YkvA (DUF1232 family)
MALAYGASPVDLIPDILPLIGILDDGIILALAALITGWRLFRRHTGGAQAAGKPA